MNEYICHSGGCPGADMGWESVGYEYNVPTIAYSFYNHQQNGKNPKILTVNQLNEGYAAARIASKTINRPFDTIRYQYVKNLMSRNWFQVKNSEAIFAISKGFVSEQVVEGGTGWAVQMAVDNKKPVFVYDQPSRTWHNYDYINNQFIIYKSTPILTKNFAGIGTRDLTEDGLIAIDSVYSNTFKK